MSKTTVLIRARLTDREWVRIRKLALDRNLPVSQMVGDALRDALLKGAKP
jgi:hypothetical protein